MSIRLSFEPEIEAGLLAQAEAQGLTLEKYLERILRDMSATRSADTQSMSPEQRAQAFEDWASALSTDVALPDDACNRENLYPPRW